MGNCCTSQPTALTDDIDYSEQVTIRIKEKDAKGKVLRLEDITFKVTGPITQINEKYTFSSLNASISGCVLPGLDPRQLVNKDCQDGIVCVNSDTSLFLGLFDGHGKEGQKIANFCIRFMKEYFITRSQEFEDDPESCTKSIIIDCDEELRKKGKEIDSTLSGTTAVVVFLNKQGIHCASVGDSRSILATIPNDNMPTETLPPNNNPYCRKIEPTRELKALPLTIDQKPNHQVELERIEKCGGKVQQLSDDYGNKVGPFRVWQKNGILPGLAMSRSVGDGVAKEIGVIAEPIYHFFQHVNFRDQFIVMASDGVWDVMENVEVTNFTERFRKKCLKKHGPRAYPVRPQNATISHFLAEEARYRWFGICEDEDVMIDDISVIVIELGSLEPEPQSLPPYNINRKTVEFNSIAIPKEEKGVTPGVLRGDVIRGSFIPAKDPNAKKGRFDPKRGSYANNEDSKEEDDESFEQLEGIPISK